MKDIAKKLRDIFENQKIYYLMVLLFFCVGIVIGVYAVKYMNMPDRQDISSYYSSFVNSLSNKPINYGLLLIEVIKKNALIIIPIIILSFTFFGAPFILAINLIKGFSLGYSFTFLLTTFSGKGIYLALSSIIPQNLIYIPCLIAISIISLNSSTERFREKFIKKKVYKKSSNNGLANILIILLCIFILGIVIETYVSPNLMKFIITKFYM